MHDHASTCFGYDSKSALVTCTWSVLLTRHYKHISILSIILSKTKYVRLDLTPNAKGKGLCKYDDVRFTEHFIALWLFWNDYNIKLWMHAVCLQCTWVFYNALQVKVANLIHSDWMHYKCWDMYCNSHVMHIVCSLYSFITSIYLTLFCFREIVTLLIIMIMVDV